MVQFRDHGIFSSCHRKFGVPVFNGTVSNNMERSVYNHGLGEKFDTGFPFSLSNSSIIDDESVGLSTWKKIGLSRDIV